MRIDPNARTPDLAEAKATNRGGRQAPASSERSGSDGDQATLDGQARIQQLQAQAQQIPDSRQQKVEALNRAIQEGRYQVGAEQIAHSLFSEMAARSVLTR